MWYTFTMYEPMGHYSLSPITVVRYIMADALYGYLGKDFIVCSM